MSIEQDNLFSGEVNLVKIGGVDIGATEGPLSVTEDSSYFDLGCEQLLGVVDRKLTDRRVRATFNLAEITLDNLQKGLAQPSANKTDAATLYLSDGEQGVTTLEFEVDDPAGDGKWIYHFYRVYITGSGEHSFSKEGQTVVVVEAECLADTDKSNRFGYVYHEVA